MSDKFNLDGFSVSETNVCTAEGGFVGDVTGNLTGSETTHTAPGAINISDKVIILASTGSAVSLSLADGDTIGQCIYATCTSSTITANITLASPITAGTDVVTFTAGDSAVLTWTSAGWGVVQGVVVS